MQHMGPFLAVQLCLAFGMAGAHVSLGRNLSPGTRQQHRGHRAFVSAFLDADGPLLSRIRLSAARNSSPGP